MKTTTAIRRLIDDPNFAARLDELELTFKFDPTAILVAFAEAQSKNYEDNFKGLRLNSKTKAWVN